MESKRDTVLCGVKVGEHSFEPDALLEEITERVIKPNCNFVYIRTPFYQVQPQESYLKWARFFAENKIYFWFGGAHRPPEDHPAQFDAALVAKLREIAGEYFLGDCISEPGTAMACNFAGYYEPVDKSPRHPFPNCTDMEQARNGYVNTVAEHVKAEKALGMPNVIDIEATALAKYNLQAGSQISILETMNGDSDILFPFERGAARAYDCKMWGTLIAHEWYGGMRHSDPLKRKRLELVYKYAYMQGANIIIMESGDEAINAYNEPYTADSEICEDYRRVLAETASYIKADERPVGGPKAKLAFVSGRHDAWAGFIGTSLWDQFHREEWGHGEAEFSWRMLNELNTGRKWTDISNFGTNDLSATPAYGTYDVVPIEAGLDALCKYEYLIFVGWNSMTDEDMDNLTEYVRRGGKLLMSVAHLNRNTSRGGALMLPAQEKLEALLGCRFTGKTYKTNSGTKFYRDTLNEGFLYPGAESVLYRDPIYSGGYVEYAELTLCGAKPLGLLSDTFWGLGSVDNFPSVIENRVGKGTVTLVTSTNYPGNPALYPLYRTLMREFVTASARSCDIKVTASDKLRYTVYEGDKIYLLNTDFDNKIFVTVDYATEKKEFLLQPGELLAVELNK
jgi:hypothetical protein